MQNETEIKYLVNLTIRVPIELREAAHEKSQRTGTTISHIVRQALEAWISENNTKPKAQK